MIDFIEFVDNMIVSAKDNGEFFIHFISPFSDTSATVDELIAHGYKARAKVDSNDDEYIYIDIDL